MQKKLEEDYNLLALRKAKTDPRNQQGRPCAAVAKELGLKKRKVTKIAVRDAHPTSLKPTRRPAAVASVKTMQEQSALTGRHKLSLKEINSAITSARRRNNTSK